MERFYHIRAQKSGIGQVLNNGGATVQLQSIDGDPLHIRMRVSHCNPSDVFSKKLGREFCTGRPTGEGKEVTRRHPETGEALVVLEVQPGIRPKEWKTIAIRNLPAKLGEVYRQVHRRVKEPLFSGEHRNFESRLREWLPKE
jgi:hypothetical protein